MWVASLIPSTPFFSKPNNRAPSRSLSRSLPPQNDKDYGEDVGGLGHCIVTGIGTNSNPVPKRHKQKQGDLNQLRGSDVLWALQRAAVKKKKRSKKRRELSSADSRREEDDDEDDNNDDVDYSNVKPLRIKGDWAVKLDELEKRLQELSDIT